MHKVLFIWHDRGQSTVEKNLSGQEKQDVNADSGAPSCVNGNLLLNVSLECNVKKDSEGKFRLSKN